MDYSSLAKQYGGKAGPAQSPSTGRQVVPLGKLSLRSPNDPGIPEAPQKQAGDGFWKSLVKDPIKELIVRPGVRIAQAGVAALGGDKGRDFATKDQNVHLPLLGDFNIPAQKSGLSGVKQIAGDAAKTASYLYTPGAASGAVKAGLGGAIKEGVMQGAKAGAVGGALYSGGDSAQQDKSAGQIFTDTLKGGAIGAATGAAIGGAVPLVSKGLGKVAEGAASLNPINNESKVIGKRTNELNKLENSYSSLRKLSTNGDSKGIDIKKMLAGTDLLHNSVDETGTIRTQEAISNLNEFIKPQEDVISSNLKKEGKTIPLGNVQAKLKAAVNDSGLKGGAKVRALKNVADDIAGYALEADKSGNLPISVIHDAKVDKYANINYLNPETKRADKAIANGLKTIVEDNTSSIDVKALNSELSQWYTLQKYLETLDGKKVNGGKLGKYFAHTLGGIAGSHFGPFGTVIGSEVAGRTHGAMMSSKFGTKIGKDLEQSPAMKSAILKGKTP